MRQIYSEASIEPILDSVISEVRGLVGLDVPQWYRGMAHSLHIHFGKTQIETISNKQGERKHETADFTLFLHGEWKAIDQKQEISSVLSSSEEIDAFISTHPLDKCASVNADVENKIVKFVFVSGVELTIFDRNHAWFVIEKFGEFAYSPKANGDVEVTKISLEK